jgi:inorganic pyrophosphatase
MARDGYFPWRPHPWHGVSPGERAPEVVTAYIEITPYDLAKYEIDKKTGYLRVDRPQRTSSTPPTLYGFIPRTLCAARVAALSPGATGGDGDPLDICVISERPIERAEILLDARPVGGLRMLDAGEADDKIIAVLRDDPVWDGVNDLVELPEAHVNRLRHYFSTYKLGPGDPPGQPIHAVYGRERALEVIAAAIADYFDEFGDAFGSSFPSPG